MQTLADGSSRFSGIPLAVVHADETAAVRIASKMPPHCTSSGNQARPVQSIPIPCLDLYFHGRATFAIPR